MNDLKIYKSLEEVDKIINFTNEFLNKGNSPYDFVQNLLNGKFDKRFFAEEILISDPQKRKYPVFKNVTSERDCAIQLFEDLGLSREKANDSRLWTYACLRVYPKYIVNRNSIGATLKKENLFKYFFFKGGSATTNVLNTISKLWWSVNQTIDSEKSDVYYYTRMLFSGSYSQVFMDVTQRRWIFSNKKVVKAYVQFFENKNKKTELSQCISPILLNHLKSFNVYYATVDELIDLLDDILEDLTKKGLV